jgi:dimethylargininase
MKTVRNALVRPVPDSYDRCVRSNREEINVGLAKKQHTEYCETLKQLGLRLITVDADNALPDSCFVEDAAAVFGEKAVICNMKTASRAKETLEVAKVLSRLKDTYFIKPPATIDGGDILRVEDTVFVGLTSRTNMHAVKQLERILTKCNFRVVPVRVHGVLHLKSACTYLGGDYVVMAEGFFETDLLRNCGKIVVPKGEEYAADCLAVNGTVLVAKGYLETRRLVEKAGFSAREMDVSEFRKGDGALTCLSILF